METKQMEMQGERPPSAVKAVLGGKCPVCRRGKVFENRFWNLGGFLKTHTHCPHCGEKFEPEPGFFWGAMYINYAFNVATIAAVGLFVWLFFNPESIFAYAIPIIVMAVATIPVTTRISRMIMLHAFGPFHFDPAKFRGEGI